MLLYGLRLGHLQVLRVSEHSMRQYEAILARVEEECAAALAGRVNLCHS